MNFRTDLQEDTLTIEVLYENSAWLAPLLAALQSQGLPVVTRDLSQGSLDLDENDLPVITINRVSPSSASRGHAGAIERARALIDLREAAGLVVINGARAFAAEIDKVRQHRVFRTLGLATPRSTLIAGPEDARTSINNPALDPLLPGILKPATGGSGSGVERVFSGDHLQAVVSRTEADAFPLLLQEEVTSASGRTTRLEFVDGELVYALNVYATNTFNLCPAVGCERSPIRDGDVSVDFEAIAVPDEVVVAEAREILRAAGMDIGGVEFKENTAGERVYFDINATSVYRDDIQEALGVDGWKLLGCYISREYHKESLKRRRRTRISAWAG